MRETRQGNRCDYRWLDFAFLKNVFFMIALLACTFAAPAQAQSVSSPTISPSGGSFSQPQVVTISAAAGDIYISLDGSIPTTASTLYTSPITVNEATQVNAVAYDSSTATYSAVSTAYLDVDPTLASIVPSYSASVVNSTGGAGNETITFGVDANNNVTATVSVSGSAGANDVLAINASVSGVPSGTQTVSYTVPSSGTSTTTMASSLASAITTNLQSAGITATSSGSVITIYNGLVLKLRSTFGLSTAVGAPPPVNTWFDLSGANNNLLATSGYQPSLLQSACINSVGFNGSAQNLSLPSGFSNFSNGLSVFMVVRPTALTAGARLLDIGDGSSGNNVLVQIASIGSSGQLGIFNGTTGTFASSASALNNNQYQLLEGQVLYDSVHSNYPTTFLVNGQPGTATTVSSIPNVSRTSNFLGQGSSGGNNYAGKIVELVLFNTGLGNARQQAVRNYFIQKYQLLNVVPPPPIIMPDEAFTPSQPVLISIASEAGSCVFMTSDGTTPTSSSEVYSHPFIVNYTQTIKAVAIKDGVSSSVASATFTLDSSICPAPQSTDTTPPTINLQLPVSSN